MGRGASIPTISSTSAENFCIGFGNEFVATSVLTVTAAATPVAIQPAIPIVPIKPMPRIIRFRGVCFTAGCDARAKLAKREAVASVDPSSTDERLKATNRRVIDRSVVLMSEPSHQKEYGFHLMKI